MTKKKTRNPEEEGARWPFKPLAERKGPVIRNEAMERYLREKEQTNG